MTDTDQAHIPQRSLDKASVKNTSDDEWTDKSSESGSSTSGSEDDSIFGSEPDSEKAAPSSSRKKNRSKARVCSVCDKKQEDASEPLKHCAKCKITLYCSRECQKADWQNHRTHCGKALMQHLSQKDLFIQLIDTYRLRIEDEYTTNGEVSLNSLYGGGNPLPDFRRFLNKAEKRGNLLPDWWNKETRAACEKRAISRRDNISIYAAVEKSDIIEHYGNPLMPMLLRMYGEKIYGKPVSPWWS